MDETGVSTRHRRVQGLLRPRSARQQGQPGRSQDRPDRTDTKTSLIGCVTDQPELQPLLPQVFLAKYTGARHPPHWMTVACAAAGFPLEYWHGTSGSSTPTIVQNWATRLRSVVHTFHDDAFILLIWDCHSSHLDLGTVRHLQMLGILTVFIPAKLTWLLQQLDVYVYSELKATIRNIESQERLASDTGQLGPGAWITNTARAVDHVLVSRDWSDEFDRLGAGATVASLKPEVRRYLNGIPVQPRLPSRVDMATLMNRQADSENFRAIYASLLTPVLQLHHQHHDQAPRRGARVPLPVVPPAQKRRRVIAGPDLDHAAVVAEHLRIVDDLIARAPDPLRIQSRQVQYREM